MKQVSACALLALLTGCTATTPQPAGSQASAAQAYCARQAEQDPEVRRLTLENMSAGAVHPSLQPQIELARHNALQRCLLSQDVPVRGGVEPVVPR